MFKKVFWEVFGVIAVLMLFFGIPLAIREASRDISLFIMWLVIAGLGFIGLCIIAIRIMLIKKKINTPRDQDKKN